VISKLPLMRCTGVKVVSTPVLLSRDMVVVSITIERFLHVDEL